ncbi:MAG TPA: hypothetical protein VM370_11115 [Candidatus Thermoplasmatota archaeon]|nr:hypothetical protein [Candidatus Thermoplasmatota archaeon]
MRGGWLLLVLLLPLAAAQEAPVPLVTVVIDAFEAPVAPLQASASTTVHARASCALTDTVRGVPFRFTVAQSPSWATTLVSPIEDSQPIQTCDQGWVESEATLVVTASDQAPAFMPAPIVVEVVAGSGSSTASGRGATNVSASYFSILDVQLPESIAVVAPGESHAFPVKLTNFGNGATRVQMRVADATAAWMTVKLPLAVTLDSKQAGGNAISTDAPIVIETQPSDRFVNEVGVVNVQIDAAYAADIAFAGDGSSISLLVTRRTCCADGPQHVLPAGAIPALAALAIGATLARRR